MTYPKNSFEAKIDSLIPAEIAVPLKYSIVFYQLDNDGEGRSVNSAWTAFSFSNKLTRGEVIEHLRGRWGVFKANYNNKARVSDLSITGEHDPNTWEKIVDIDCAGLAFASIAVRM